MHFPLRQLTPADFPELLREISDMPERLFIRGELPQDRAYLCVVGSRAASPYGRRQTASLIAGLAKYPVAIVSGLALGIDAEAHKAALEAGLPTVAVLPSSADDASIYPSTNRALAKRILEQGGTLISEHPEPHKPMQHNFPERNRIMAGLSKATLLIEASEKSGTLITARLALDYNREVLAIPHELGRESGSGSNRMLREGATLVRSAEDIAEALGFTVASRTQALPLDLTAHELLILEALREPLIRDELIERASLPAQHAAVALSSLLIRGLISERLGKIERA